MPVSRVTPHDAAAFVGGGKLAGGGRRRAMMAAGLALVLVALLAAARTGEPRAGADVQLVQQRGTAAQQLATAPIINGVRYVLEKFAPGSRLPADAIPAAKMSQLDMADEGGDEGVQVAATVKGAVGGGSAEGENLGDEDYGTPEDMAAVQAVQAAVKAGAEAEVDDAVAKSKAAALTDYASTKTGFMAQEAKAPDGGVGGIIAMEGEPGHPKNYARERRGGGQMAGRQRRARGPGAPAPGPTKLAEKPMQSFEVRVPTGLVAGQQFVADVPSRGQMLVTVPAGLGGGARVALKLSAAQEVQHVLATAASTPPSAVASTSPTAVAARSGGKKTSSLDMADEGGDEGVQVAATVKGAVGGGSAEGENLGDEDYGTPEDMAAVQAVQAAVKAGAEAEVDDAVAKSKAAALTDYASTKTGFMAQEAKAPDGGVGGIIAMEGEPGHPKNYARERRGGGQMAGRQRRARGPGAPAPGPTKLAEKPMQSFEVRVPTGLVAGQQFVADVPSRGQMLVTVPAGLGGGARVALKLSAAQEVQHVLATAASTPPSAVASTSPTAVAARSGGKKTSSLDMADEGGDEGVQVAATVKGAVGGGSAEGENLGDEDYGTPEDMAAVQAVQAAVKAGAEAEVDDAVAKSKAAALTDYASTKTGFMAQEAKAPDGGVGGIIAMEGEPGHPKNYARERRGGGQMAGRQRRARGPGAPAPGPTKLAEKPMQSFEVRVPTGLVAGQQFVAAIPGHTIKKVVTVPVGVSGGQMVEIQTPFQLPFDLSKEIPKAVVAPPGVAPLAASKQYIAPSVEDVEVADGYIAPPVSVSDATGANTARVLQQEGKGLGMDSKTQRCDDQHMDNCHEGGAEALQTKTLQSQRHESPIADARQEVAADAEKRVVRRAAEQSARKEEQADSLAHDRLLDAVGAGTASPAAADKAFDSLKAAVLKNERHGIAHPEEGMTEVEAGLVKRAERQISRAHAALIAKAQHARSAGSAVSSAREGLGATLRTMGLSFEEGEAEAKEQGDAAKAKEDAEYIEAIHGLLDKIGRNEVPRSLPAVDGFVHAIPDRKSGGDPSRRYPLYRRTHRNVPQAGDMDEWKADVQRGLEGWRHLGDADKTAASGAGRTDSGVGRKGEADGFAKSFDSWTERVRKVLGDAAPKAAPAAKPRADSLTDEILTDCGLLRGSKVGTTRVFKGIPYAMAPVGELRWAPPVARSAMSPEGVPMSGCWSGTLLATEFGAVCPQEWDPVLSQDEQQHEDCLSLNVYAPTVESEEAAAGVREKLPVVVFVHGGGNVAGAGSRYDMWQVADRGFVAVTLNYRLGALGFLALKALSAEAGASGNYGIRDVALALQWVQRNIANFGGDPARVTLMGHGSGGTNVLGLAMSPLATTPAAGATVPDARTSTVIADGAVEEGNGRGAREGMGAGDVPARVKLFHGMVLLSASPRIDLALSDAEPANEVFAVAAGCVQEDAAAQRQCLRALGVADVLRASPGFQWNPSDSPRTNQNDLPVKGAPGMGLVVVDGDVIPEAAWSALAKRGHFADVPVMAMVMAEEADAQPPLEVASWGQLASVVAGRLDSFGKQWAGGAGELSLSQAVLQLYPSATFPSAQQAYENMVTDARLTCATKRLLGLLASSTSQKVYMGVNHLRLEEPVAVVALASSGVRAATPGGLAEALVADHRSRFSFHGLDILLYMQDETRWKFTAQDRTIAAGFQGLLDAFVRSGSTKEANKFSAPNPLAWEWKPVTDSPDFISFDSPRYPTNVDVADITGAMGEARVAMTYDFHSAQCAVWARQDTDLVYASAG